MGGALIDDLRREIAHGNALVVVGAGVSVGATAGAPTASWTGLLLDGVDRVDELHAPGQLPDDWADLTRSQITSGDLDWLLAVAEDVTKRLGGPRHGEFRSWLREALGKLEPQHPAAIEALAALGAPIATTNYDGLIEAVLGVPTATWQDPSRVQRVLRRDEQAVLHLHGFWDDPASVVLGIRSYEALLGDRSAQALQQAMAAVTSLVFVGFGEGLSDPNFGALRRWIGARFASSEYRHIRLCLEHERERLATEHDPAERIVPLAYGSTHDELAGFLEQLAPSPTASAVATQARSDPAVVASPSGLPPEPFWVGREAAIGEVADSLLQGSGPVVVLGAPGIGKSTVSLAAMYDDRIVERFGTRRWFVRCDGATSAPALLTALATELGLTADDASPSLLDHLLVELAKAPALIALDNLETPWGHDGLETERLLGRLAGQTDVALLATVRGTARPGGVRWTATVTVVPLGRQDSRLLFLAIAGEEYAADPRLDALLDELDGVPLAVELLAHAAQGEPDLGGLAGRWRDERVALLQRLGGENRELSVAVSVEVSLTSPLLRPDGRCLLTLLGQLPEGISHTDLAALLGDVAPTAANNVRQLGLAFDEGDRLRVLAPIREHLAASHPPAAELGTRLRDHYLQVAIEAGSRVGSPSGASGSRRIAAENGNLNLLIERHPVEQLEQGRLALRHLLRYGSWTGNDLPAVTAATMRAIDAPTIEAGDRADLLLAVGNVALGRSAHDTAREHYDRALTLYEQTGNVLGQASSIESLGNVDLDRTANDTAGEHFSRALMLYEQVHNSIGQANCIKSLGDVALAHAAHDTAREYYDRALTLYQQADNLHGQAICIESLGDIALDHSAHDTAYEHFNRALTLYEQTGSVHGQANCIESLGDIALDHSAHDTAREHYNRALTLFQRIREPYSIGTTEERLATVATSPEERARHLAAAQDAWSTLDRPDLIAKVRVPRDD